MSRLDYHSILNAANVDVDAEFDNPTILDHNQDEHDLHLHDHELESHHHQQQQQVLDQQQHHPEQQEQNEQEEQNRRDILDVALQSIGTNDDNDIQQQQNEEQHDSQGIMNDEQDDTPFIIIEENPTSDNIENHENILGTHQNIPSQNEKHEMTKHLQSLEFPIQDDPSIQIPPTTSEQVNSILASSSSITDQHQTISQLQRDESTTTYQMAANGGMSLKDMSLAQRKERQKLQNKQAAERSRHKRKAEQLALEKQVEAMQEENIQLKSRLSELLASKSANSPMASAPVSPSLPISNDHEDDNTITQQHPTEPDSTDPISLLAPTMTTTSPTITTETALTILTGTGIDYNYINKLTNELNHSKSILLQRQLYLIDVKNGNVPIQDEERNEDKLGTRDDKNKSKSEIPLEGDKQGEKEGEKEKEVIIDIAKEELKQSRKEYLSNLSRLISTKAEESSLKTVLEHVQNEIKNLVKQREQVSERLIEKRNNLNKSIEGGKQPEIIDKTASASTENNNNNGSNQTEHAEVINEPEEEGQTTSAPIDNNDIIMGDQEQVNDVNEEEINQDKALDDIRGWINAAVQADWNQLPQTSKDTLNDNDHVEDVEADNQGTAALDEIAKAIHNQ
ncbi:uncharacterized protein L201_000759 [Kwoniella dendrophila CBS 6074]|uniref:BZIP domain-containing protein n=1 Tax=Kwoniella dendrophila CBS 6074 TaxID=1295534 RepID=A0AAX4JKF9_9TREE